MGLCFQKSCVFTASKFLWDITINVVVKSVERLEKGRHAVAVLEVLSRYLISEKTASTTTTKVCKTFLRGDISQELKNPRA